MDITDNPRIVVASDSEINALKNAQGIPEGVGLAKVSLQTPVLPTEHEELSIVIGRRPTDQHLTVHISKEMVTSTGRRHSHEVIANSRLAMQEGAIRLLEHRAAEGTTAFVRQLGEFLEMSVSGLRVVVGQNDRSAVIIASHEKASTEQIPPVMLIERRRGPARDLHFAPIPPGEGQFVRHRLKLSEGGKR